MNVRNADAYESSAAVLAIKVCGATFKAVAILNGVANVGCRRPRSSTSINAHRQQQRVLASPDRNRALDATQDALHVRPWRRASGAHLGVYAARRRHLRW